MHLVIIADDPNQSDRYHHPETQQGGSGILAQLRSLPILVPMLPVFYMIVMLVRMLAGLRGRKRLNHRCNVEE